MREVIGLGECLPKNGSEKLFRVFLSAWPGACFGILVARDVVVDGAPIARWAFGKRLEVFAAWVRKKGGTVKEVK